MITPQDIRDKTFEKAVFGGYDMGSVDDFLDGIAADLANSQKEIVVLKAKMKVLVDKIEEYRANENALNMALLSAQKLSVQIEADARHKAEVVLAEANAKADAVVSGIAASRHEEEAKLQRARQETANYIATMRRLYDRQLKSLDAIDEGVEGIIIPQAGAEKAVAETAAPIIDSARIEDAIRSIDDSVARIQNENIEFDNTQSPELGEAAPASRGVSAEGDTQLFAFDRD